MRLACAFLAAVEAFLRKNQSHTQPATLRAIAADALPTINRGRNDFLFHLLRGYPLHPIEGGYQDVFAELETAIRARTGYERPAIHRVTWEIE